jgi:hypothetical protein
VLITSKNLLCAWRARFITAYDLNQRLL